VSDEFDELDAAFDDDVDDEFEDDDATDDDGEGNLLAGARARAVVEYVARQLADDPDAVGVTVSERRGEVTLLLHASPDDLGRLIGRRGRTIQAMRQVGRAAGAADGVRISVDIAE
jgi:predicted RNA-binding protein YlqC (UPF0109 family)